MLPSNIFQQKGMPRHTWFNRFCFFKIDLEIKDKGTKNAVANHMFQLIVAPSNEPPINESSLDEQLMSMPIELWYAEIVNYLDQ